MIRIRQHGDNKELFDINRFVLDIEKYFSVKSWFVSVDWCSGENSEQIESITKNGKEYSNKGFKTFYKGIYQTIDGKFEVKGESGEVVVSLLAVDSSFWEIESENKEFLEYMYDKYGEHKSKMPNKSLHMDAAKRRP